MVESIEKTFREEALPLVMVEPETSKFIVNNEALEFIQLLEGPVGVVSVAGLYRTGKSYLLNRVILNKPSGFGVGPTVNPCTKGIWIWGKPLKGQTPDGEILTILVIDTEGIGALDEDSNHDCRIFSLAIMLSSCFIYNSVGSIDESAIQNLSLVINITKHIHLKSNGDNDEVDSDEYAQYFPSFLWVVRDFTLQLVDPEGEPITSKEYLEMALQPQKGFTEQIENKNRIRRLIQSFFKERECYTMVRPLMNEEELQNLDQLPLNKLRPEFVEQVLNLRKKIITNMRPKRFKNQLVSGPMLIGLLTNYVNAINEGGVPNIENSWASICRESTLKAKAAAFEEYEEGIRAQLGVKFPVSQGALKMIHESQKMAAEESFQRKAIGEDTGSSLLDLNNRINERYEMVKLENKREFERLLISTMAQQYTVVENKMRNNEYRSFYEFEKDLKAFQKYFEDLEPQGPNKSSLMLEFISKRLSEASHIFIKQTQSHLESQLAQYREFKDRLEREVLELKDEKMRERNQLMLKVTDLETVKAELEVKRGLLDQSVQDLKKEKNKIEEVLKAELKADREEYRKIVDELKDHMGIHEEKVKEMERSIVYERSEFEKEKALLIQKIAFYEKTNNEFSSKESSYESEMLKIKTDLTSQMKGTIAKYESDLASEKSRIKELRESKSEIEEKFENMRKDFDTRAKKMAQRESELLVRLNEAESALEEFREEIAKKAARELEEACGQFREETKEKYEDLERKLGVAEAAAKEREEKIKGLKAAAEKEKAIYDQNIQFLEMQVSEMRQQLENQKSIHEGAMKALDGTGGSSNKTGVMKTIQELKELHKKEKTQLENELDNTRRRLQLEVETLHDKLEEMEKKSASQFGSVEEELLKTKNELALAQDDRDQLSEQCKAAEEAKARVLRETEDRFKGKIASLEEEIEIYKDRNVREMDLMQNSSEESLKQLKAFYEEEKVHLEKKLQADKMKFEKRVSEIVEEYEQKIQEDQRYHEEEIENLQEELKEIEIQNMAEIQQLEREANSKQQELETMEKALKETKEALASLQASSQANLEQILTNFAEERKALTGKIDSFLKELNGKEREIFGLVKAKENLEQALSKKEISLSELKAVFDAERRKLEGKCEELKKSYQKVSDEFMEKKIVYGKEIALATQQNEFMNKKIDDQQRLLDEGSRKLEERVRAAKEEHQAEIRAEREKLIQEKEQFELRYESKRKALKEIESSLSARIASIEKEKMILQEKLGQLDSKKSENEKRLQSEVTSMQGEVQQLRETLAQERKSTLAEMEKLRKRAYDLEMEMGDVLSSYEKDKALWEGKFSFLENQRDQMKSDLVDAQRNFEIMLQKFQKYRSSDKEETESTHTALIASIEQRYASQVSELNEAHKAALNDMADKQRRQEKEIKHLNERLMSDNHGKLGSQSALEKKIGDLIENEKRLIGEISRLKGEQDGRLMEQHKVVDQEKNFWKTKLGDMEAKYKESEGRKSNLMFEHEKERAKWIIEKDHLISQRSEFLETIDRLEKKKEQLLRENEKLRNESRTNRKLAANTSNLSSLASGLFLGGRSGEGSNRSSQINSSFDRKPSRDVARSHMKVLEAMANEQREGVSTLGGSYSSAGRSETMGSETSSKNSEKMLLPPTTPFK